MKISNNRRPGDVVKQLDTIAGQMKKTERSQQSKRLIERRKVVEYETCFFLAPSKHFIERRKAVAYEM